VAGTLDHPTRLRRSERAIPAEQAVLVHEWAEASVSRSGRTTRKLNYRGEEGFCEKEELMSIQSRIRDAEAFWKENRKEKALLAVLSAANDTARRRYSRAKEGKETLAHFITDVADQLVGGTTDIFDWSFRGGTSLGEVLYDVYRGLLETGQLPSDVELVPDTEFQVQALDGNRRAYSDCLIPRLIDVVRKAPENKKEFSKRR
jgi:hypothetical protein